MSNDNKKDGTRKPNRLQGYLGTKFNVNCKVENGDRRQNVIDFKPDAYQTEEFNLYEQRIQSGDFVGSTILNILQKLIVNENNETLVQTSATVKSLWFSISQYYNIEQNHPFRNVNHEKMKRKLVTITFLCLNKIFPSGKKLEDLFDVKKLLTRLINAIEIDYANAEQHFLNIQNEYRPSMQTTQSDSLQQKNFHIKMVNLNALCYSLFLIIQNILINRNGETNLFESLFDAIQANISIITKSLCLLMKAEREQKNECIDKILNILLKMIYILNNIEAQLDKSNHDKLKIKRKLSAMATTHHKSYKLFKCLLESIVMYIAQDAKADKLRMIFRFFRKYTICCCNIHLNVIRKILENSLDKQMHKICLNFIKQNVLRTVFANNIDCLNCDSTKFLFEFKENFITLYKTWFQYLTDPFEVIVFFKHISKISKYLHVDVQSHLLVDIVLPVFRKEKHLRSERIETMMQFQGDDIKISDSCSSIDSMDNCYSYSDKLIICCLNIFLCYLKDITVIKAFFIEENIQHLADLFVIPQFAYLVSNLLKIGIDNSQFLGETIEERRTLCEKLESLQVHLFNNIIELLIDLFNDMSIANSFKLKRTDKNKNKGKNI